MWGETGGSETPASHTFYSRFPSPTEGVPASLFSFYCEMLRNIAKFFSFSPGSRHFGNPASCPFSSRLPYPSRPLFSGAPAPLSPFTLMKYMCALQQVFIEFFLRFLSIFSLYTFSSPTPCAVPENMHIWQINGRVRRTLARGFNAGY